MSLPADNADVDPHDPLGPLRLRDYRLYLAQMFLTTMAHQAQSVAIGWDLYERTGSALALGWVGLFQFLPVILLFLPAGQLADRFDRRWVMVLSFVVWGGSNAILATAPASGAGVGWIYLAAACAGVAQVVNRPARDALLAQLLPSRMIVRAIAWNSTLFQVAAISAPAVAGLLIAATGGATAVYAINVALSAVALLLAVLIRRCGITGAPRTRSLRDLFAGIAHVRRTKEILAVITLDLFAVLFGGATALLPIYAKDILQVGPAGLGWLTAAASIGAVAMSLALGFLRPMRRAGIVFVWSVAGYGVAIIVFGLSTWYWLSFTALMLAGALDNISVVIRNTVVQIYAPDDLRGRVSAVNRVFVSSSNELGAFESGLLAALTGPVFTVVFGGVATVGCVALGIRYFPGLVRMGSLSR